MPKKKQNPKCKVCLDPLLDDGRCRHHCDPKMVRPSARVARSERGTTEKHSPISLSAAERERVRVKLEERDPLYDPHYFGRQRQRRSKIVAAFNARRLAQI